MTVSTDEQPTTSGADAPATAPATSAGRGRAALPWVLLAVAVGWAIFATLQYLPLAQAESDRQAIQATSLNFLQALTNWDASEGLDVPLDEVRSYGTAVFQDEAASLFRGELGQSLEAIGASSVGEVVDLFVQRADSEDALVFAVVRQELSNDVTTDVDEVFRGVRVFLLERDGTWLVDDVELLGEDLGEPVDDEGDA